MLIPSRARSSSKLGGGDGAVICSRLMSLDWGK